MSQEILSGNSLYMRRGDATIQDLSHHQLSVNHFVVIPHASLQHLCETLGCFKKLQHKLACDDKIAQCIEKGKMEEGGLEKWGKQTNKHMTFKAPRTFYV